MRFMVAGELQDPAVDHERPVGGGVLLDGLSL